MKSMNLKPATFCFVFLLFNILQYSNVNAQGENGLEIPAILLPSPNAAELGKYGEIPVNMSTGALNFSLPLFVYSTKNLELPISVNYNTNGFRVNAISSRAGFDWVLNVGGTITRTIVDEPDLINTTISLPKPNMYVQTDSLWDYLYYANQEGYDTQPDIFYYNFNGYTGRFVVNDSGRIVPIPHNNLKYEYTFTADSSTFKITTPDGVQYFFGGDSATEHTRVVESSVCGGQHYRDYIPTAWNLKKIIHPNGDWIAFDYETGNANYYSNVWQTIYSRNNTSFNCNGNNQPCPLLQNQTCYTRAQTIYSRPKRVSSSSYGTVEFTYHTRSDMTGDGLIETISLINNQQIQIKKFLFEHQEVVSNGNFGGQVYSEMQYRYFLTKVQEFGRTGSIPKNHLFTYSNLNNLPPRLSFGQDYLGYFNGAYNTDLVPKPADPSDQAAFSYAGGNRSPDETYVQYGLLSKITYPTGGTNNIVYESHKKKYYKQVAHYPVHNPYTGGRGDDTEYYNGENVIYTDTFTARNTIVGNITAAFFHDDGITDPDNHIRMKAEILVESSGQVRYSKFVFQNQNLSGDTIKLTLGIRYRIRVSINAPYVYAGSIGISYTTAPWYDTVEVTTISPGARVKQVLALDSMNDQSPEIISYHYKWLSNNSYSNVEFPENPIFIVPYSNRLRCIGYSGGGLPYVGGVYDCNYRVLYSNPQNAETLVPSSTMYRSVLQSSGANFENGGKEYVFFIEGNNGSFPVMGLDQIQAAKSNTGYPNGTVLQENTFRMENNQPVYLKRILNTFKSDARNSSSVKGYFISRSYDPMVASTVPHSSSDFLAFNVNYNLLGAPWMYLSKTESIDYDNMGNFSMKRVDSMIYDNPGHAMITRTISETSKGDSIKNRHYYPQDTVLTGTEELARQQLISINAISTSIAAKSLLNSTSKIQYSAFKKLGNSRVVLEKLMKNTGTANTMETVTAFAVYDNNGNLQEAVTRDGVVKCYLYGYKSQYPVAEITGELYNNIKNYITQSILDNPVSDTQLRAHLNILRNSLPSAFVKTFTYEPLVGITSETDANGRTQYYEYDSLNRLTIVRDSDNNIIKRICYNYHGQPENCGL